jgi:mono/diheme cytochrome c family protein
MVRAAAAVGLVALTLGVRFAARPPAPAIVHTAPPAVHAGTPETRGREVYRRYGCVMCHGPEGRGGFANPNAETDGKVPGVIHVAEGYTRAELRKRLIDGTPTVGRGNPNGPRPPFRMPGWGSRMTAGELDDLVAYLMSLNPEKGGAKWR